MTPEAAPPGEAAPISAPSPKPTLPAVMAADGKPPSAGPPPAEIGEGERALLLELRARRKELDERAAATGTREAVVAAAEKRLTERVSELEALQARLEGLDKARQGAGRGKLARPRQNL